MVGRRTGSWPNQQSLFSAIGLSSKAVSTTVPHFFPFAPMGP